MNRKDFEAYQTYMALRNHFLLDSYDYFKYNGKTSCSRESLEKRRDKFCFTKLAKHPDVKGYLLANFMASGPDLWIGTITGGDNGEDEYYKWKKRKEAITYYFKSEYNVMSMLPHRGMAVGNGFPALLTGYYDKSISAETLIILNAIYPGMFDHWSEYLTDQVLWPETRKLLESYAPFVEFDKEKCRGSIAA